MGKKQDLSKMLGLLQNLTDPSKLLKAVLPLKGRFLIDAYKNFPYAGKTWDLAIFFKELDEGEELPEANKGLTLGDLLPFIKIGQLEIRAEELTWHSMDVVGIFLKAE